MMAMARGIAPLSQTVMVIIHMWTTSLIEAAYMIAIKRTNLIFSTIYGKLLFKGKHTLNVFPKHASWTWG